jgi:hypothetical protein
MVGRIAAMQVFSPVRPILEVEAVVDGVVVLVLAVQELF